MKKVILCLIAITCISIKAQVKIGDNPNSIHASSMLELESTNKGFLPPRVALVSVSSVSPLASPVPTGMIIYNSGINFNAGTYLWNGVKWQAFAMDNAARENYVLVKSVADFPAAVGGIITLLAGTLYEVNGAITLSSKIDLNNCSLIGGDENNDKLIYTGAAELFTGSNGGTLRHLTLTASSGMVFNVNSGGNPTSFIVESCFFLSNNSIGILQGVGGYVYFGDNGFYNNAAGITFQNSNYVYMNNSVWDIVNSGTYERFVGAFNTIQILGGSRNVNAGSTILSITAITSLLKGSIKATVFKGSGTYVSGAFNTLWEVEAAGLNTEKDDVASGNIYISNTANTTISTVNVPVKILGTTTSLNLFRMTSPASNRLTYVGSKSRRCLVVCSLTSTFLGGGSNKYFSFYIAKNGSVLPESRQRVRLISSSDQGPLSISCLVLLAPNDYVEVWVENNTDGTDMIIQSLNLSIK